MPSIWKRPIELAMLNTGAPTALTHLGIEFTEIGEDFVRGRVPVDDRTKQPFGLLHGGISVVLAETLGSIGATFSAPEGWRAVGLDINATHHRSSRQGRVTATATAIHLGSSTTTHEVLIENEDGARLCTARITNFLKDAPAG